MSKSIISKADSSLLLCLNCQILRFPRSPGLIGRAGDPNRAVTSRRMSGHARWPFAVFGSVGMASSDAILESEYVEDLSLLLSSYNYLKEDWNLFRISIWCNASKLAYTGCPKRCHRVISEQLFNLMVQF